MPELHSYDYAIVRIVPCAERGEFLNAGIVLHSSEHGFLESRVRLDESRLRVFWPEIDYDAVREHLEAFPESPPGTQPQVRSRGYPAASAFSGSCRRAAP